MRVYHQTCNLFIGTYDGIPEKGDKIDAERFTSLDFRHPRPNKHYRCPWCDEPINYFDGIYKDHLTVDMEKE